MDPHGGLVLAGGGSVRMGRPKASLPWHGSTLLRRVTGLTQRGVDGPVVVVAAFDQELPALPADVQVLRDPVAGRGPLQAMAVGLAHLAHEVERVVVCSTDLPLLHPLFVRRLTREPGEIVLPFVAGHRQPLAACYATSLLPALAELLTADLLRPAYLLDHATVTVLDETALLRDERLRTADPQLLSVRGANTPEQYAALLDLPLPAVTVERYGVLARAGVSGPVAVRAATLGAAATAVGLVLDRHLLAAVGGDQTVRDPETPLAEAETVLLLSGDAGG